ncbi:questin oxidase family protein [Streptomyces iconiensis]|uniref:Questin oxidase family protein n=1 Tax=Streptomyces iconiensis TaxID=1384038 RepID=A0ABT6ZV16_9ACTN|nr:questin oxidase family protein [Streptomyces iconiensis]MDJ1132908.1 questin oxidase family protein [Streptomyces iconiensis]
MDTRVTGGNGDTTGTLDEALVRLHASGPERMGWLSNHAPMAVEALVRHGEAPAVHRWIDRYRDKLEDMPGHESPVTDANWREALGDPRRLADWTRYFALRIAEHPWRAVLAEWWPRLLPGISGAATHPVIRTGHAVRTLLSEGGDTEPRRTELAHALGYWAARHHVLTGIGRLPAPTTAGAALEAVPLVADRSGGIQERLARITALPDRPVRVPFGAEGALGGEGALGSEGVPGSEGRSGAASGAGPAGTEGVSPAEAAREVLVELVRVATHRYATHAHGEPVMLVHAATAPNAVLRTLPALPSELWAPSVDAAWAASAAVTASYGPGEGGVASASGGLTAREAFARAAAHGDEHAIKLADTAWDVALWAPGDDAVAVAAALSAVELIEPLF